MHRILQLLKYSNEESAYLSKDKLYFKQTPLAQCRMSRQGVLGQQRREPNQRIIICSL